MRIICHNLAKGFRIRFKGHADQPVQRKQEYYGDRQRYQAKDEIFSFFPGRTETDLFIHSNHPPLQSYADRTSRR